MHKARLLLFVTTLFSSLFLLAHEPTNRDPVKELVILAGGSNLFGSQISPLNPIKLLKQAYENGHIVPLKELVRLLVDQNVLKMSDLYKLAHQAAGSMEKLNELKMYLELGIDPNMEVEDLDASLLAKALNRKNFAGCDLLLEAGADSDSLYLPNLMGSSESAVVLDYIYQRGLISHNDIFYSTPIYEFMEEANPPLANKLLEESVNATIANNQKPSTRQIVAAISFGNTTLLEKILKSGGNPFAHSPFYQETMPFWIGLQDEKIADVFLRNIDSITKPIADALVNLSNKRPFAYDKPGACDAIWSRVLEKFPSGYNMHANNNLIEFFVNAGCISLVRDILSKGEFKFDHADTSGQSLIEIALRSGQFQTAEMLKEMGSITKHPVVVITTSGARNGEMYVQATQCLGDNNFVAATLTVPNKSRQLSKIMSEIIAYLAKVPNGASRAQAILDSKISSIQRIVDKVTRAIVHSDAIWISGGSDIWPGWYNSSRINEAPEDIFRDILDFAALEAQKNSPFKPLIGVCRGNQALNVFYGGTLHNKGESGVNPLVVTQRSGFLGGVFPAKSVGWSMHSQSISQIADSLEPVALTTNGMIKAVQSRDKALPLMGTQFHPEQPSDNNKNNHFKTNDAILTRFLSAARASEKQTCLAY